ncbi:CTAG/Pcc1 family [Hysterangium stoloniferum]|nr:CTAG/Pcc1 family [Hysterangium stoloniferum]
MVDPTHSLTIKIPFLSANHAEIAMRVLQVDAELQPNAVKKSLVVEGSLLIATFTTLTVRLARLTLNSFLENVDLITRTLAEFANEAEQLKLT